MPSKYPLPPLMAALYGAGAATGLTVPCVVLPLRVMVNALGLASKNVLFCAPLVPLPASSKVT